ncbi:MAG: hypothetical protein ACRDST_17355 [Pseudonocardiaceae bacterium]
MRLRILLCGQLERRRAGRLLCGQHLVIPPVDNGERFPGHDPIGWPITATMTPPGRPSTTPGRPKDTWIGEKPYSDWDWFEHPEDLYAEDLDAQEKANNGDDDLEGDPDAVSGSQRTKSLAR